MNFKASQYADVELSSEILSASPRQLISILFDNGLKQMAIAKIALEENNINNKCLAISKAIDIISYLRSCLNHEAAPQLSQQLNELYQFAERQLFYANARKDAQFLEHAYDVLKTIKDGWDGMPEQPAG